MFVKFRILTRSYIELRKKYSKEEMIDLSKKYSMQGESNTCLYGDEFDYFRTIRSWTELGKEKMKREINQKMKRKMNMKSNQKMKRKMNRNPTGACILTLYCYH
jgi:hypothetical protein